MITNNSDCINIEINKIVDVTTGINYEDHTIESSYPTDHTKNHSLNYTSIRSVDKPIPHDLEIHVTMSRESHSKDNDIKSNVNSDFFEPSNNTNIEKLGAFVFHLHLGNYKEPKVTLLNKDTKVKGQTIHINSVTEYPTGTEISVNIPDANNYIINGLDIKALDINGDEWDKLNGVTSVGPNQDGDILYYLESDYFSSTKLSKIKLTEYD